MSENENPNGWKEVKIGGKVVGRWNPLTLELEKKKGDNWQEFAWTKNMEWAEKVLGHCESIAR